MIAVRRILCPVDLSEFSARALEHAVALARWYRADVDVVHVFTATLPPPLFAGEPGPAALTAVSRQRVEEAVREFIAPLTPSEVPVSVTILEGTAATRILDHVRESASDLIVIGTHGRSGFERLLLGSVTEKVIRKASCPVLTVPPRVEESATEPVVAFKRIVCAIDFSRSSVKSLEYALSLAQEAGARLTLLHVLDWPDVAAGRDPIDRALAEARQHTLDDLARRLHRAVPDEVRTWCDPEEVIVTGSPHREIVRVAGEKSAELIVMGVHGRGALDLTLFGSTASYVVRHAACPVLTVRSG
ncbi:MAG TPA: universal stress protein [Vicinamibacterales bacterium]|nr:universal stress protein [Vicinamibacterales bacterium]